MMIWFSPSVRSGPVSPVEHYHILYHITLQLLNKILQFLHSKLTSAIIINIKGCGIERLKS